MSEKQEELTPEQEAMIPVYVEEYLKIGMSTAPTDRPKAEAAIIAAYRYLRSIDPESPLSDNPTIFWEESPFKGAKKAAELAAGTTAVTKEMISDQASRASYGALESYWVSFYAFIVEQLPGKKDDLLPIIKSLIQELGAHWSFEDCVVLTPKPCKIQFLGEVISCLDGPAILYPDGEGIYALDGVHYNSLMELKLASLGKTNEKTNSD